MRIIIKELRKINVFYFKQNRDKNKAINAFNITSSNWQNKEIRFMILDKKVKHEYKLKKKFYFYRYKYKKNQKKSKKSFINLNYWFNRSLFHHILQITQLDYSNWYYYNNLKRFRQLSKLLLSFLNRWSRPPIECEHGEREVRVGVKP